MVGTNRIAANSLRTPAKSESLVCRRFYENSLVSRRTECKEYVVLSALPSSVAFDTYTFYSEAEIGSSENEDERMMLMSDTDRMREAVDSDIQESSGDWRSITEDTGARSQCRRVYPDITRQRSENLYRDIGPSRQNVAVARIIEQETACADGHHCK